MVRLFQGWCRVLVGLVPTGLVLVACSSVADVSNTPGVDTPQGEPTAVAQLDTENAISPDDPVGFLTINVDMTDDGFKPPWIFIPAGRGIQLVLRNRGTTEHHFRVLGLVPTDLLWRVEAEGDPVAEGVTDEEHDLHHNADFVPFRSTSAAGIRPIGDEVHGYAERGQLDMIRFVATNTGTFAVQCPLHPGIGGTMTVF
jgi:hypothetical protein